MLLNLLAGFFSHHCAQGPSIKCSEAPGYDINSGQGELMPQLINTKQERKEMRIRNTQRERGRETEEFHTFGIAVVLLRVVVSVSMALYSCIFHLVFLPAGALPL